jgi:5-formyltetrahydrofolate cyclo-ligase
MRARLFTWFAIARDDAKDAGLSPPQVIAAFWPLGDEPDLRPLMSQWDDSEIAVALPIMMGASMPLQFHRWHSDMKLTTAQFGVMQPEKNQPCIPDVILVPTLGFTAAGDRIGYGQGYYDRTLEHLNSLGHHPVTIGIAWSEGAIETIDPTYKPAAHDYRLDGVLTPGGWIGSAPTVTSRTGKASV